MVNQVKMLEEELRGMAMRADVAEAERDAAVARAEKAEKANRVGDDMIRQAQTEMMRALGRADRAEARVRELEADERLARNPHVVDRVRSVIDAGRDADVQVDLDAGDDPVVYAVRESDIEDCQRNEDGDWEFRHSGRVFHDSRDPADRAESLTHHREQIAQRVAIIRAIEAEQATDPVEELAEKIESATRAAIRQVCDDLTAVAPSLDPLTVERAMEVTAASRKVAAHGLGQEARDGVDR